MKIEVEIEHPAEWMERLTLAALTCAAPSAILKRLGRALTTHGEPTLGATLDLMALLMVEAERDGLTISLPSEAWADVEFIDHGAARVVAETGRAWSRRSPMVHTGHVTGTMGPKGGR